MQNPNFSGASPTRQSSWGWAHGFVVLQFVLQIMLLSPVFGVLRAPMRVAVFGLSLLLLAWIPIDGRKHPCVNWAIAVLAIMSLEFFFHDDRNNLVSALAQCMLYVAIIGPVFWATRLKITFKGFYWLILIIWGFHTISSGVGVLQVLYPGQFQGALSTAIQSQQFAGDSLKIILSNGQEIYRPQGLTDIPGGAATAGFYAALFGVGIAIYESNWFIRIFCLFSSTIGIFCIYLSQVRSTLVMLGICLVCLMMILYKQRAFAKLTWLTSGVTAVGVTAFAWSARVGGEETVHRFSTLVEKNADQVYYENRGLFLEGTIKAMFEKPLGFGLGRWGPISDYFGDNSNPMIAPVWVEIQWTGWLVDGGIPMIVAYTGAIAIAVLNAWSITMNRKFGNFTVLASLILVYDVGAVALTFNYPLFISQQGMEFWLLNAALFTAAANFNLLAISTKTAKMVA